MIYLNSWLPPQSFKLIRYLCWWRVNSSLARIPGPHFGVEVAKVLGNLIAERLPTRQAASWYKLLNELPFNKRQPFSIQIPEKLWPIDIVILPYPCKQTYGEGELVLIEFKLFCEASDHDLFLEILLPAMEEASYRKDPRWTVPNGLWGNFDVGAVYVAGGGGWYPLVSGGRLDLRYRPSPWQWSEAQDGVCRRMKIWRKFVWIHSFDLDSPHTVVKSPAKKTHSPGQGVCFALSRILEALLVRLNYLLQDAHGYPLGVLDLLDEDEREWLEIALDHGENVLHGLHDLSPSPSGLPGRWMGTQKFPYIPAMFIPYLDLAAILHVGRHTQFGCGTFVLE